jgi:hypothetical protein
LNLFFYFKFALNKKNMKKLIVLLLMTLISIGVIDAQKKPSILFESRVYDFGQIKEEDGRKTARFAFKNIGNDTLKILNVRASCGCTTSDYTRTPVLPGQSGYVDVAYNPLGRPGNFNKIVTVITNDPDNPNVVLTIKGSVIPKPKTKADNYPQVLGNLRFKSNHITFNDIKDTEIKTDTIYVYNPSDRKITIYSENLPSFLKIHIPAGGITIAPDQELKIPISYDAKARNDYGYVFDNFRLKTDDIDQPVKQMYVSANIIQDFSWMTEKDKTNAPKIVFEKTEVVFDTIKMGESVIVEFPFRNEGKNDLKILKVKSSCGCTAVAPEKNILKKGEKSSIKVTFNTAGRQGNQQKSVTVITNDPEHSIVVLTLKGYVKN